MDTITTTTNPTVKLLRALSESKGRREQGAFLVEGAVMIDEALSGGLTPLFALSEVETPLLDRLKKAGAEVKLCARHVLESACDTKTPQGICASFRLPAEVTMPKDAKYLLAIDGVQDPGNMGTILRTADAAGFQGAFLSGICADVYSPKVQRSAMGSGFRVPTLRTELPEKLAEMQKNGYKVVVSALDGLPLYENEKYAYGEKLILVIGNEAKGVTKQVQSMADIRLKIPMRGKAESLNAAVAAGILMYELFNE